MRKIANILDFPKPTLDPLVWEKNQNLKSNVKVFILDFISSFAQANNLKSLNQWVSDIQFVGGLTTNTYNPSSDADIHMATNLEKFIELERPEMSEKEASDYLDTIRKQIDQVKAKIPNTLHPVELYFNTKFTPPVSTEWSGIYSILNDKWLEYPHIVDQNFDIEKLHPELLQLARETASELDSAFGEIKRDVADIKDLQETISEWPEQQRELFEKKLQKRLDDLENEIKELVDVREDVAEKRKHYKALSEQEVRFKYLQKYFYMHVLTDLKILLKQSPELTTKDIPVVENIMSQASQESEEKILAIDFDDTIVHENPNHSLGTPMEGVREALTQLKNDGYKLEIYSHRADTEEGADEIKEYLDKNDIPYDSIFHGDKPLATYYIDDRGLMFTNWKDIVKKVEEGVGKKASINLPTIDPTTFNRKEPYALFIGTQMFSKNEGIDLFDVYGQHPMITEHNARPTVTLDTLVKENIPIVGKAPRAGNKQPIQDLSGVVKTAQLGSEYDYSSTQFNLPKELSEKIIRWAIENIPEDQIVHDSKDPGTKGIQLESHITLKYGLKTNSFEDVEKALKGEKAPHIKFGKTSFFSPEGKDYDVVIINVESDDLQNLSKKLCDSVEHEDTTGPEYHPHVTVAYIKRNLGAKYEGLDILEGEELDLSVLTFSPKSGEQRELELKKTACLYQIGDIVKDLSNGKTGIIRDIKNNIVTLEELING